MGPDSSRRGRRLPVGSAPLSAVRLRSDTCMAECTRRRLLPLTPLLLPELRPTSFFFSSLSFLTPALSDSPSGVAPSLRSFLLPPSIQLPCRRRCWCPCTELRLIRVLVFLPVVQGVVVVDEEAVLPLLLRLPVTAFCCSTMIRSLSSVSPAAAERPRLSTLSCTASGLDPVRITCGAPISSTPSKTSSQSTLEFGSCGALFSFFFSFFSSSSSPLFT
mmetsp:Transcript_26965/g.67779  ORF Transcript_26965/g.67779 Transcript_26965/m.67779 type:complete len:218 (+) Transcript_26965:2201-2854(+)